MAENELMESGVEYLILRHAMTTPEQLREVLVFLVHYVGYPRAAGLLGLVEKAIQEGSAEG